MNYEEILNKEIQTVPPSGIRKFFDIAAEMKDCISLGVGEPDFVTPWNICEAAIDSLKDGITCYTSNSGLLELRQLICRYYSERYGVPYLPNQALVTVGASEAIDLTLRALLEPGDEVLVPEPSYVSYSPGVRFAGGVPVAVVTNDENGFKITGDILRKYITSKTKAVIFPYPNNPTGGIMTKAELEDAVRALRGTNIMIISDEIYSELTYDTTHVSVASIADMYERTIVLNGFSKAFAMTGWRLGYALAPQPIIAQMTKIHQFTMLCAPTFSQYAGVQALKHGFDTNFSDVAKMRREYNRRRRFLVNTFNEMGLSCFEPLGAFYVFPSIRSTGLSSQEFCEGLLYTKKVATVPGTAFGASCEGHIRCAYAYSMDHLIEATKRIREFAEEHQTQAKTEKAI